MTDSSIMQFSGGIHYLYLNKMKNSCQDPKNNKQTSLNFIYKLCELKKDNSPLGSEFYN